ncbi:hypothetical protein RND71_028655 [Anisodus tanguticus]|uniref:Uncharacterized protein n=1 Tax=Anisodus tanguticus TaxID=243964 RepID=A0AAE1V2T6_9SOLA|nr:hypothetical protein RND71_028655 [Anisodus tanguticus]
MEVDRATEEEVESRAREDDDDEVQSDVAPDLEDYEALVGLRKYLSLYLCFSILYALGILHKISVELELPLLFNFICIRDIA